MPEEDNSETKDSEETKSPPVVAAEATPQVADIHVGPHSFCKLKRRRVRTRSSSSDGAILDVGRAMTSMNELFMHPGKLRVFQAYFNDPSVQFVRPEGRREPVDDDPLSEIKERQLISVLNQAGAVVGYLSRDTGEPAPGPVLDSEHSIHSAKTAPIGQVYEGDFSDGSSSRPPSSRGLSSGSSFQSFHSGPDPNPEPELVPFAGLDSPPTTAPQCELVAKPSERRSAAEVDLDEYMASISTSDSDEDPMPDLDAMLGNMKNEEGSNRFQSPESMSVGSDPLGSSEQDSPEPDNEELDNAAFL